MPFTQDRCPNKPHRAVVARGQARNRAKVHARAKVPFRGHASQSMQALLCMRKLSVVKLVCLLLSLLLIVGLAPRFSWASAQDQTQQTGEEQALAEAQAVPAGSEIVGGYAQGEVTNATMGQGLNEEETLNIDVTKVWEEDLGEGKDGNNANSNLGYCPISLNEEDFENPLNYAIMTPLTPPAAPNVNSQQLNSQDVSSNANAQAYVDTQSLVLTQKTNGEASSAEQGSEAIKDQETVARPDTIYIWLLRNGQRVKCLEFNNQNNGGVNETNTLTFSNLPVADANGEPYIYSIEEEHVSGFVAEYEESSTGWVVINAPALDSEEANEPDPVVDEDPNSPKLPEDSPHTPLLEENEPTPQPDEGSTPEVKEKASDAVASQTQDKAPQTGDTVLTYVPYLLLLLVIAGTGFVAARRVHHKRK